jgi:hypothetical protein
VTRDNDGPGEDYLADQSDALGRVATGSAYFGEQTLVARRLVDVFEAEFNAGTAYQIRLERMGGESDIAFEVFPSDGDGVWERGSPEGLASEVLDADTDTLALAAIVHGRYPIVVYRVDGIGALEGPVGYDLTWGPSGTVDVPEEAAGTHTLVFHGAVPNPMTDATQLRFELARRGPARLAVFDLRGRHVCTVVDGVLDAGPHAVTWNGRAESGSRLGSGIYWVRLDAGGASFTKRVVLLE